MATPAISSFLRYFLFFLPLFLLEGFRRDLQLRDTVIRCETDTCQRIACPTANINIERSKVVVIAIIAGKAGIAAMTVAGRDAFYASGSQVHASGIDDGWTADSVHGIARIF